MLPTFVENLMDEFYDDPFEKYFFHFHNPLANKQLKNWMRTDVKEKQDHYEISIDLPGFKRDEIDVEVADGYLTVRANKKVEQQTADEQSKYVRQERYNTQGSRSFYVGDVKPAEVQAEYEFGVLKLVVPKRVHGNVPGSNRVEIR